METVNSVKYYHLHMPYLHFNLKYLILNKDYFHILLSLLCSSVNTNISLKMPPGS